MDTHRTGPWFGTFPSSSVGVLCFGDCPFVLNLTYLETPKPKKNFRGAAAPRTPRPEGTSVKGVQKTPGDSDFYEF